MDYKKIFLHLMTESDNTTHDLYKYLSLTAILVGLCLQVYAVVFEKSFSIEEFGIGVGAMFTGIGAALKLKPEAGPGTGDK